MLFVGGISYTTDPYGTFTVGSETKMSNQLAGNNVVWDQSIAFTGDYAASVRTFGCVHGTWTNALIIIVISLSWTFDVVVIVRHLLQ